MWVNPNLKQWHLGWLNKKQFLLEWVVVEPCVQLWNLPKKSKREWLFLLFATEVIDICHQGSSIEKNDDMLNFDIENW